MSGSGIPAANLDTAGDYYLDKGTYNFYGPKTAADWGTPTALQGPQGPMGNANIKIDVFSLTDPDWLWKSTYNFGTDPGSYIMWNTRYYERKAAAPTSNFLNENGLCVISTPR